MDHEGRGSEPMVWEFNAAQVSRIWTDTRQVFGNKLWVDGVYDVFLPAWRMEAERRSGHSFFDLLCSAVGSDHPSDPSEVFRAFQREFSQYDITTVFEPHPAHGDVLERARRVEAGEPLPGTGPCHLDEDCVTEIWDGLADGFANGRDSTVDCAADVAAFFPEDFVDALEIATGEEAFLSVSSMLDGLAEDDDHSQAFLGLRELAAEHGIELTFAPHPVFGDLVERARRLRADESDLG